MAPRPGQLPDFPEFCRRNETGTDQAMAEETRDPLGILAVGLMAAQVAHVVGVADHQGGVSLKHTEDRNPVDSGGLHPHRLAPGLGQPIQEFVQSP
jgi:hypothetical protein